VAVQSPRIESYCDSGTLSEGQCVVTVVKDYPASLNKTCTDGYTLRADGKCAKEVPDDYEATRKESCADGSTPVGGQCMVTKEEDAKQENGCLLGALKAWPSSPSQQACMTDETVTGSSPTTAATACRALGSPVGATLLGVLLAPGASVEEAAQNGQPQAAPLTPWYCGFVPVQRYVCLRGTLVGDRRCRYQEPVPSTKSYSCPGGGSLEGTVCRRTRTDLKDPATSYSCPGGGSVEGTMCRLRETTRSQAKTREVCEAGYTKDGSICYRPTGSTPTAQYSCDPGWTPNGGQCSYKTPDKAATVKYVCTGGSAPGGDGRCASSEEARAYVYLGGKLIAEAVVGGATQYVHTDALGSPVARTGSTGALISRTRFEPYGYVAQGTKPSPATSQIGFTGHVQDGESELVYMQQRYYDPIAGRFLSVDPIVTDANTGAGFGLYTYVDNNPYAKIDPDGREPAECSESCTRMRAISDAHSLGTSTTGAAGSMFRAAASEGRALASDLPSFSDTAKLFLPGLMLPSMAWEGTMGTFDSLANVLEGHASKGDGVVLAMAFLPAAKGIKIGPRWQAHNIADMVCERGCEAVASQIQRHIGGKVVRITPKDAPMLGSFRGKNWGWSHHEVVVKDGRVYDLTTGHKGIPASEYKSLWQYSDSINFGF